MKCKFVNKATSRYNASLIAFIATFLSGVVLGSAPRHPHSTRPDLLDSVTASRGANRRILAALEGNEGKVQHALQRRMRYKSKRLLAIGLLSLATAATLLGPFNWEADTAQDKPLVDITETNASLVLDGTPDDSRSGAIQAAVIRETSGEDLSARGQQKDNLGGLGDKIVLQANPMSQKSLLEALEGSGVKQAEKPPPAQRPNPTSGKSSAGKPPSNGTVRSVKAKNRAGADTDVALLTELVAAVNETEATAQTSNGAPVGATQANRDIVERTSGDSTIALLARCRRLGFLEGELCRWRICSGHHEDPACAPIR